MFYTKPPNTAFSETGTLERQLELMEEPHGRHVLYPFRAGAGTSWLLMLVGSWSVLVGFIIVQCLINNLNSNKNELSPEKSEELLGALKAPFEKNINRYKGLDLAKIQAKLEANPEKLWSLN